MKSKITSLLSAVVFTAALLFFSVLPCAEGAEYTADEVSDLISGIVSYKLSESGCGNTQDWINGKLTDEAGRSSEWYIITLSQNGFHDLGAYENALIRYLDNNSEPSASSRLKYALSLSASGSSSRYITEFLDNSAGQQGIMSWIYALHVLNNGYNSSECETASVINELLSLQFSDGGWALFGEYGDIDVTAMTINALAPYYNSNGDVHSAVDRGVDFLSQRQQDDGGYKSFGTSNSESASQVLTAMSAIGINCQYDERFIKNGNNVIDGIVKYRLDNGSFRHTEDGESNDTATVQAMYALTAYRRMLNGQGPLFVFDNRKPVEQTISQEIQKQEPAEDNQEQISVENKTTVTTTVVTALKESVSQNTVSPVISSAKVTSASSSSPVTSVTSEITTEAVVNTTVTNRTVTSATHTDNVKKSGNKMTVLLVIAASGIILSAVLFLAGKRNFKNYIFIGILTATGIIFVLLNDIQSAEDYYNQESVTKDNIVGTVTLEIRCDTILGKSDSENIPDDAVILKKTEFEIEDGETVFDILTEAARKYGIQIENKGSAGSSHGMTYIAGINYIYEFDFGDLSGWVYHINGVAPSVSCGEYTLSDGDCIEWLYTCELGHDLGEVYE